MQTCYSMALVQALAYANSLEFGFSASHSCLEDYSFVKVQQNSRQIGQQKSGHDCDEDHGHLVLGLSPPDVAVDDHASGHCRGQVHRAETGLK